MTLQTVADPLRYFITIFLYIVPELSETGLMYDILSEGRFNLAVYNEGFLYKAYAGTSK